MGQLTEDHDSLQLIQEKLPFNRVKSQDQDGMAIWLVEVAGGPGAAPGHAEEITSLGWIPDLLEEVWAFQFRLLLLQLSPRKVGKN